MSNKRVGLTTMKPCPFCGDTDPLDVEYRGDCFVLCPSCQANGPVCSSSEKAVKAWNRGCKDE